MEHWVEFPPEPSELTLAWRAPEQFGDRTRWAVGILSNRGSTPSFRYLEGEEFRSANQGRDIFQLKGMGYRGYPAFESRRSPNGTFTDNVMEAFLRRLPPGRRSDFPQYLELYRYRGRALSPMSLLALTAARLPSDGFSLIDRLDSESAACDTIVEIMGFRHHSADTDSLEIGCPLTLQAEPGNPIDADAVRVESNGAMIGYVDRFQARSVGRWLETRSVSCWLLRKNGKPHVPVAFAFLRMRLREGALAA